MVPTQKLVSNSRTFQDNPGHFQLIFQDNHHKNQGHSRTNLEKKKNFKNFQGQGQKQKC